MSDEEEDKEVIEVDGELILCVSCGVTFLFDKGERDFFRDKGLQTPKRCSACRRARREGRQFEAPPELEDEEDKEHE